MKHAKHIKIRKIHTHIHKIQTYAHICRVHVYSVCVNVHTCSEAISSCSSLICFLAFAWPRLTPNCTTLCLASGLASWSSPREKSKKRKRMMTSIMLYSSHTHSHTHTHTHIPARRQRRLGEIVLLCWMPVCVYVCGWWGMDG
jgi:hypothetical protein